VGATPRELPDYGDFPAFNLSESAPDPERLADIYCVVSAGLTDGAHLAYGLGAFFSSLALILALKGRRGKEEVGMIAPAECFQLPFIRQPHRCPFLAGSGRRN
jgi:hypothetical protein